MTTEADIKRIRTLDIETRRINQRMIALRESMYSLQYAMDGMPHGHSNDDKFAAYVARMDDLMDEYAKKLEELEELEFRVSNDLDALDQVDALIVQMKGIDHKTNAYVARKMHYSVPTVIRHYRASMEKLSTLPQKDDNP